MTALDELCTTPFHDASDGARARVLSRLADTELFVALTAEPVDDGAEIRLFDLPSGPVALACDGEERLANFMERATPFAAMPGRVLADMLQDQAVGLLVNPGCASEILLDPASLTWLRDALAARPEADEATHQLVAPQPDAVAALAQPLAERLADMHGLIAGAALAGTDTGGHLVIVAGADAAHQPAIAKALAEALAFLPDQPGGVDIAFSDRPVPGFALQFDLTPPAPPPRPATPKGPPILR